MPAALPLPNSYWVLPGQLLAGEHPGGSTAVATRARLGRLLEAGVSCFIDLTQPDELPPYDAHLPPHIDYLRMPIPDHGIPAQHGHMGELLDRLHDALRAGRVVYLHCRAGIGRTGTVVGCLLAENGLSGQAALEELNRLWQQSERAQLWAQVPETPEQTEYVRRWVRRDASRADPLFEPANQYRRPGTFTPVGDMLGGGPFDLPRGGWSDDTAMALCLAESLLGCEGFDGRDQVARYRRWQHEGYLSCTGQCLGITAGTARALARAQWRRQPFSGSHDPGALDPEALSRVAPVAMYFFAQPAAAAEWAAEAARTTCQAPAVLTAGRALAQAVHAALSGKPRSVVPPQAQAVLDAAQHPSAARGHLDDGAPAALAAALEAFAGAGNFRDAVLSAANLGGNSDVVAAACGSLAGAHYTASAIPTLWRNSLIKKQLIESCADRLLARAMLQVSS